MERYEIENLVQKQREYFNSGATLPLKARISALRTLKKAVKDYECALCAALRADLGKTAMESYMCEVGMLLNELSHMIKHLPDYARENKVKTPLVQFASRSYECPTPYGNVLIMSPWNYPVLLTLGPLVDAIAAGNTAIIKPSAYSPNTSEVIRAMLTDIFPQEFVAVVMGGRAENTALLEQKFDFIFFTGGSETGKTVLRHAAEHLTPVALELGGKSPCVVTDSAKLPLAARRIVFGKFLNCGQTCVAPDFIYCDRKIFPRLLEELKKEIARQSGDYGKIINRKHFDRLVKLLDDGHIAFGGEYNEETLQIFPTIITDADMDSELMTNEIFGPILPIICYDELGEVEEFMNSRPKPLAFYLFTQNKRLARDLMGRFRFGGGCVNDTIIHLATTEMGFGGVGESGMGAYHGRTGFEAFSHRKSIVDKKNWIDLPMRYRPYTKTAEKMVKMFLK